MSSEPGISDAWLLGTPHYSRVCPYRSSTFGLWCHEMLWASFDLNRLLCVVNTKALGLQDAVQISYLVLVPPAPP